MRKPEQKLQNQVANWIRLRYPYLLWTISPAGLVRGANMAVQMKRMGYTNGTPDIIIFEARGRFHGLLIELKDKDGTVSEDQRNFIAKASFLRYATAVCFSYEEAIQTVENYMKLEVFSFGASHELNQGKGGIDHEQDQGCGSGLSSPQRKSDRCTAVSTGGGRPRSAESPF